MGSDRPCCRGRRAACGRGGVRPPARRRANRAPTRSSRTLARAYTTDGIAGADALLLDAAVGLFDTEDARGRHPHVPGGPVRGRRRSPAADLSARRTRASRRSTNERSPSWPSSVSNRSAMSASSRANAAASPSSRARCAEASVALTPSGADFVAIAVASSIARSSCRPGATTSWTRPIRYASAASYFVAGQQPAHRVAPARVARQPDGRAAERVDAAPDLQFARSARRRRRSGMSAARQQLDRQRHHPPPAPRPPPASSRCRPCATGRGAPGPRNQCPRRARAARPRRGPARR